MSATATRRVVHVIITGRVQGVGYRAWTASTAERLGLAGWVRNRRDGSVEAMFSGPADVVDDMVGRCRFGPRSAEVSGISVADQAGDHSGFEVRATE